MNNDEILAKMNDLIFEIKNVLAKQEKLENLIKKQNEILINQNNYLCNLYKMERYKLKNQDSDAWRAFI